MNNNTCYFCNEVKPNTDFPLQNKYRFVIPNQLISSNVLAHHDRESLGIRNFGNVSTWDIMQKMTLNKKMLSLTIFLFLILLDLRGYNDRR